MEEQPHSTVTINIHGGNNQILPNATKAEQHFHYTSGKPEASAPADSSCPWSPADEDRLSFYIEKVERRRAFIAMLTACQTAAEVGEAVVRMCGDEPRLDKELIVKAKFIEILVPFLVGFKQDKGKGIDNLRVSINNALAAHRRNRANRS